MISAIRPFMKGELPISSPVSGLRSGAPEGSVSRQNTAIRPSSPRAGEAQSARFLLGERGALLRRGAFGRRSLGS